MKKLAIAAAALMLAGCASAPKPSVMPNKAPAVKSAPAAKKIQEPCPCSPTANQVVKKRWFSGFKVRLFH